MNEDEQSTPNQPTRILVPKRYNLGNQLAFFDDFFELGGSIPAPTLKDGTVLEWAKYYLCCVVHERVPILCMRGS
jgi:hypothetical protein